ncbi:MAG: LD-carboxypeptidase [Bacteroidales bacterium]|nr:LD-carboxypeptidase [Bacteroidales bacterium]
MIYPDILKEGDKVAIVAPASAVEPQYIYGAAEWLRQQGLTPVIAPHALGRSGSYSAPLEERLADWLSALADTDIKAILCGRGGYGCIEVAAHTPRGLVKENPKWVIGYSDVSALHALMWSAGIASIHSPMAKHLAQEAPDHYASRALAQLLKGDMHVTYALPTHPLSHRGQAQGRLLGGNLTVLSNLAATELDMLAAPLRGEPVILFLEDIHEAIYAVERMLMRLWLSGVLSRVKGLIFGHFTDYRRDANYSDMEQMIEALLRRINMPRIPVAYRWNVGHVADNLPLIEGAWASLIVAEMTELTFYLGDGEKFGNFAAE